jgi:hypothetical protein
VPDTRAHDEVYCPDCGLQWVASQGVHSAGCRHLDLAKHPTEMDDDELLRLALWLADGGVHRQAPSQPDWSAEDYRMVRGVLVRLADDCQDLYVALAQRVRRPCPARQDRQPVTETDTKASGCVWVPPGRPAPLSMGAGVEATDSRPEPEPTKPEPEPPPEPTKPPQPEPPKPEATAGDYDQLLQTTMRWVEVA